VKDNNAMINRAKDVVKCWYNEVVVTYTREPMITKEQIYIVWFSKTLGNWKALVSTDIADTRYYEVTYNGERDEIYLDVYLKEANVCIK
jgi:hypothetical protein